MPDVIEMPYTPPVVGGVIYRDSQEAPAFAKAMAGRPGTYLYRFGGPTCLAGDEIGVYSFKHELHEGDSVVFGDMAIYTMVKNNTFNGVNLPDIVVRHVDGSEELVRKFGYADFACRL